MAAPSAAALSAAIAALAGPLRHAAADPDNAWALAHGVLAFGAEFETRDGALAVDRLASFVEARDRAGRARLLFPRQRDGQPVEPHPHIVVHALLDAGLPLERTLPVPDMPDGKRPTLARLLRDLRAELRLPTTDTEWLEVAWGMDALTLGAGAVAPIDGLRQAALARLEAEQRVLLESTGPAASALRPDSPLGAAKRGRTQIFAHACGGLHFAQAVFHSVARDGDGAEKRRAMAQLSAIARRFEVERLLYRGVLAQRPDAGLLIARQQLKFFGHLAETLVGAQALCQDDADRTLVTRLRAQVLGELLATVERLESLQAYATLPALEARDRQTYLDLIGDGCHALRALRAHAQMAPPPEVR